MENIGKRPIYIWLTMTCNLNTVIFYSYVKLPKGNQCLWFASLYLIPLQTNSGSEGHSLCIKCRWAGWHPCRLKLARRRDRKVTGQWVAWTVANHLNNFDCSRCISFEGMSELFWPLHEAQLQVHQKHISVCKQDQTASDSRSRCNIINYFLLALQFAGSVGLNNQCFPLNWKWTVNIKLARQWWLEPLVQPVLF